MAGIVRCLRPSLFDPLRSTGLGSFWSFDPFNLVYLKHCVDILGVSLPDPSGYRGYLDRVRHFRVFTCKVALQ